MHSSNIVIHIHETLDDGHIHRLERDLGDEPGVLSACCHEKTPHLMVVDFDADSVRPSEIVRSVRSRGLHAEMLGL
jgi:hypothetical protein